MTRVTTAERRAGQRPTVKDVAARAGVSPKTVSNVLTGTVPVREETRARVEQAMGELDFVPNLSARGLRNGRSGVVALALPDLNTGFSASIVQHAVRAAHDRGLALQVEETAQEPQREFELISRARAHLVDGLILNPVTLEDSAVEHTDALPPVVLIGEVAQQRTDHVWIDSRAAAREVAEHVIGRGARTIVALGAPSDVFPAATARSRMAGVRDAAEGAGLPSSAVHEAPCDAWTSAEADRAMRRALDDGVRPDAVVAFTDSLAVGALAALREHGLESPRDVLVTGFDDVDDARWADPALTTIAFDRGAYVRAAFDLLAERIADRDHPPRRITIPHTLVVRRSTTR